MITIAKLNGALVEIVKVQQSVEFSTEQGWILIVTDFQQPLNKQQGFKWVPSTTRFTWVREYNTTESTV